MVTPGGVTKLIDFGSAKDMLHTAVVPEPDSPSFANTVAFSAPEVLRGELYDYSLDTWSLGCMCWQLALNRAPHEEAQGERAATLERVLREPLQLPPDAPADQIGRAHV